MRYTRTAYVGTGTPIVTDPTDTPTPIDELLELELVANDIIILPMA